MIKTGSIYVLSYPSLIHYTCVTHEMNPVEKEIRRPFSLANNLTDNAVKFFVDDYLGFKCTDKIYQMYSTAEQIDTYITEYMFDMSLYFKYLC